MITSHIHSFTPVLKKYLEINKVFLTKWNNKDCPWFYGERSNIGILAASVWKVGGIALEEYNFDKSMKDGRRKQKYIGRNDLYFKIGGKHYIAEAKHFAMQYPRKNYEQLMKARFNAALEDARLVDISNCTCTRLGILFVVPRIRHSHKEHFYDYLEKIKKEASALRHDAIAWTFPKVPSPIIHSGNNDLYPGKIIIIKRVSG